MAIIKLILAREMARMRDADRYFATLNGQLDTAFGGAGDAAMRQAAFNLAQAQGLPNKKIENWHYTDLERLLAKSSDATGKSSIADALEAFDTSERFSKLKPLYAVFRNGKWNAVASCMQGKGLHYGASGTLFAGIDFRQISETEAMPAYNQALASDGLNLLVDGQATPPLIVRQSGENLHLRHRFYLMENARATIIMMGDAGYRTNYSNLVSDIELAENAALTLVTLQNAGSHIGLTRVTQAAHSRLTHIALVTGGTLARHEICVTLNGAQAHAGLYGAVLGRGENHADLTAHIHHQQGDTTSETRGYYVLDEAARGVFQGTIKVERDAQHVDAQMQLRAMMLSDQAEMDAKPELAVYADDVACAHGSAIGALDEDSLFFLRSRGLSQAQAQNLLIGGFLMQVLAGLEDTMLHDNLAAYLQASVAQFVEAGA